MTFQVQAELSRVSKSCCHLNHHAMLPCVLWGWNVVQQLIKHLVAELGKLGLICYRDPHIYHINNIKIALNEKW